MSCTRITGKRGPVWRLKVTEGDSALIFFGHSFREVVGKYQVHLRQQHRGTP